MVASLSLVSLLQSPSNVTGGAYSDGSLTASGAVMELNGVSTSTGTALPDVQLGVGQFDGAGNITLFQTDENNGGTPTENTFTGTYSVDPDDGPRYRDWPAATGSSPAGVVRGGVEPRDL